MSFDYPLGFISANFVARVDGFPGGSVEDWHEFAVRTRAESDPNRVADWLPDIADLGFDGLSLWTSHCWYHDQEVDAIVDAAETVDLDIYSYAGDFGSPPADANADPRRDWRRTYETAAALGCERLAGRFDPEYRDLVAEFSDEYGVSFAYENHPEESPDAIREVIAGYEDTMGIAFDTGWAGTQGFDAAEAIRDLDDHLEEVHLKNVASAGTHRTCTLGDGVVDIQACLDALDHIGFDGWVTIEHEPFDRDPLPEIETSLARIERWQQ